MDSPEYTTTVSLEWEDEIILEVDVCANPIIDDDDVIDVIDIGVAALGPEMSQEWVAAPPWLVEPIREVLLSSPGQRQSILENDRQYQGWENRQPEQANYCFSRRSFYH